LLQSRGVSFGSPKENFLNFRFDFDLTFFMGFKLGFVIVKMFSISSWVIASLFLLLDLDFDLDPDFDFGGIFLPEENF
jgi:hypothetical protein